MMAAISPKEAARVALHLAIRLRRSHGIPMDSAVSAIDLAERTGVEVWFQDVPSLEGMYSDTDPPRILLPADRPMGRQQFACAHELGHHLAGHSTRADEYLVDGRRQNDVEERLADLFGGYLLMPKAAVEQAFRVRQWDPARVTAAQAYCVACALGVSYEALVTQMQATLQLISFKKAAELHKRSLPQIRRDLLDESFAHRLVPVDVHWTGLAVDLWLGDHVLLPADAQVEGSQLRIYRQCPGGCLAEAVGPGMTRAGAGSWTVFLRVCRARYAGRASYRFLEDPDAD
jgi:Zn-dependent peptidase ImmA (M78 family)